MTFHLWKQIRYEIVHIPYSTSQVALTEKRWWKFPWLRYLLLLSKLLYLTYIWTKMYMILFKSPSIFFSFFFQLLDLFLNWDWSAYLADYGQAKCKYVRVKPDVAISLLEKWVVYMVFFISLADHISGFTKWY